MPQNDLEVVLNFTEEQNEAIQEIGFGNIEKMRG